MLEAVIFDMDGVLIDSEPLHYRTDIEMLERFGINIEPSYLDRYVGTTNTEMWKEICADLRIQADLDFILRSQLELKISLLESGNYRPIRGVEALIADIGKNGLPIAVASSSQEEFIEAALKKIGLFQYIRCFVSGENVPKGKPEPDVFLKAAELLGVGAESCLVIEDSKNGVKAAKSALMKCIGYANPHSGAQDLSLADLVISDFSQFSAEKARALWK